MPIPVYDIKNPADVEKFKDKLLSLNSNAGWLKNFELKSDQFFLPKLHDIEFNYSDKVNLEGV
jgi:hypothetical protein